MSGDIRDRRREGPNTVEDHVMAAVDRSAGARTYVIADVTLDDAWLAMPEAEALPLARWR